MNFPKLLTDWRKQRKFTQQAAADFLRVSRRSYEKWEQGERTPRGLTMLTLIEKIQTKPKGKRP